MAQSCYNPFDILEIAGVAEGRISDSLQPGCVRGPHKSSLVQRPVIPAGIN